MREAMERLRDTLAEKILEYNAEKELVEMLKIYKKVRQRQRAFENMTCYSKSESSSTSDCTTISETSVRDDAVGSVSQTYPDERDVSASNLTPSSKEGPYAAGSSGMSIKVESEDTIVWKPRNTRINYYDKFQIKIGDSGRTWMKKKDYDKIKFNNYRRATRTILMGVFGSRTLATHTRSGKTCPIYKNMTDRKVKPQLPEVPLEDIRMEIRKHFNGLADELINESITTKCADEGRKYKNTEGRTVPED